MTSPRHWLVQALHFTYELEGLLRWIAGEAADAAVIQALDEAERLLAPAP
ncbi:MAG: hypothetical protein R3B09_17435 [Nannocystaceae bacterium]